MRTRRDGSHNLAGWVAILASTLLASVAQADRGGLTLEVSGGGALQNVDTPYSETGSTKGFAPAVQVGARYALTNWLEVGVLGVFHFPGTYYHNGTLIQANGTAYRGTLRHGYYEYGGLLGVRGILGREWRPFAELGLGWLHRSVEDVHHIDDSNPSFPQDYYLGLANYTRDNLAGMASIGIQWSGDNFVFSVAPRFECAIGRETAWNLVLPISIGWTFYI